MSPTIHLNFKLHSHIYENPNQIENKKFEVNGTRSI